MARVTKDTDGAENSSVIPAKAGIQLSHTFFFAPLRLCVRFQNLTQRRKGAKKKGGEWQKLDSRFRGNDGK
jgi:hypothetical protein